MGLCLPEREFRSLLTNTAFSTVLTLPLEIVTKGRFYTSNETVQQPSHKIFAVSIEFL